MAILRKVIQRPYIVTLIKIEFDRRQQECVDNGASAARRQRTRVDATTRTSSKRMLLLDGCVNN